jgi:HNH endonuclease
MKRTLWTEQERNLLREKYANTRTDELVKLLPGRTISMVYGQSSELKLKKSPEFLASESCGIFVKGHKRSKPDCLFKKGEPSWNAGKKGFQIGGVETQFKKGSLPHNTQHDGAISIRTDSNTGKKYQFIRIANAKWELLQRHVWKKHFGPITKGMIVSFKDRDTLNVLPENLELITHSENMQRNTIHRYPDDIKAAIRTVSKLVKTINQKKDEKLNQ